jgi:hypothetical protein
MLTVSLDCLSSSCILCTQCWQCLSIVYRHPVSGLPNVDSVSRLFIFILYLVHQMLTVTNNRQTMSTLGAQDTGWRQTMERKFQHWAHKIQDEDKQSRDNVNIGHTSYRMKTCLSIVYRHPVSGLPNVDSVSGLFVFILYLVCPMLPVSLGCLFSSCILCAQCWQWHTRYRMKTQSRDTVNTGDTSYRMKTQSRETVNTGHTRYRMKTQSRDTVNTGDTRYRMKTQ